MQSPPGSRMSCALARRLASVELGEANGGTIEPGTASSEVANSGRVSRYSPLGWVSV